MAEEAAEGGGGGGDGGGALKKYGPLAAIVLLAQVVLAWVIIQFVLKDNLPTEPEVAFIPEASVEIRQGQEEAKDRLPFLYVSDDLNQITANPAGTNAERFVVISVQLGLEAYDRDESPPDDDITEALGDNSEVLDKIGLYNMVVRGTVIKVLRNKTVDELDAQFIHEVEEEIRKTLNKEVFERLFKVDDENTIEVNVVNVYISDLIIQ